ncbi:MAG TPA: hypothetical protein VII16_03670 [Actinomycetes bacterium]|jgi:hypothetical protein
MGNFTDQVGPQPYGPDQLVEDLTRLLTDHGFAVTMPASRTAEVRWHSAALLTLLLGSDKFKHVPSADYERGLRDGFAMGREVYEPGSSA